MLESTPIFMIFPVVWETQNRHTVSGTGEAVTALDTRQFIVDSSDTLVNISKISRIIPRESITGREYSLITMSSGDSFACAWSIRDVQTNVFQYISWHQKEMARLAIAASWEENK